MKRCFFLFKLSTFLERSNAGMLRCIKQEQACISLGLEALWKYLYVALYESALSQRYL